MGDTGRGDVEENEEEGEEGEDEEDEEEDKDGIQEFVEVADEEVKKGCNLLLPVIDASSSDVETSGTPDGDTDVLDSPGEIESDTLSARFESEAKTGDGVKERGEGEGGLLGDALGAIGKCN